MDTEVMDVAEDARVGLTGGSASQEIELQDGEPQDDESQDRGPQIPARLLEQLEQLDLEHGNGGAWDDLEALYGAMPEEGFLVDDVSGANLPLMETHARGRNYLERLIAEREAHAERMLADAQRRIEAFRQRAIGPVQRALQRHEDCLARLLALSGKRAVDLVAGRVEFTPTSQDLQKVDKAKHDEQIVAWLKEQGLTTAVNRKVTVEEKPDMRTLKKLWRTDGVTPPHTHVVTVGGNLKITLADAEAPTVAGGQAA